MPEPGRSATAVARELLIHRVEVALVVRARTFASLLALLASVVLAGCVVERCGWNEEAPPPATADAAPAPEPLPAP